MGSKKRSSNSIEGVEFQLDTSVDNSVVSKPLKKKMKKDKGRDAEVEGVEVNTPSSTIPDSGKPMERKKKRKTFDKERKRAILESEESKSKQIGFDFKADESKQSSVSVSNSGLPQFHISVFKDLSSADIFVRESAAEALATELQKVQEAYDRLENKDLVEGGLKLEAEKDDGLDNCAPSVRYAVRRLVRGVSSSRECARQGFALGLTMLIGTQSSIKVDSLMKLIVNLLEVSSSMKGQEARDCLLGRLFAYGALVQSRRLECSSDINTSHVKEITSILISLAAKKRYLQEPAVAIILELIGQMEPAAVLNHVLEAPGIQEWFEAAIEVGNPDALLLALKVREKISVDCSMFAKLLPNPFNPSRLFAADHLSSLVNCLKESTFCQPRVHSLWPVLLNLLLPETVVQTQDLSSVSTSLRKHKKNRKSGSSEEEVLMNFQNFFEVIIEGALLPSSHDRKHMVFDVLLLLLPKLPATFIPTMLSYKVVQCLMDILSTKDSWLHKVVQNFLKELLKWVLLDDDDVRRVAIIVALQKHSNGKFDCITRTKTVQNLMSEFKTETGCIMFIQNLTSMFVDETHMSEEPSDQSQTTDDNSEVGSVEDKDSFGTMGNSDILRTWIIESLPCILKHLKLEAEAKFRVQKEILKFLVVQGLFTASLGTEVTSFELQEKFKWPKAPTSSALCMMCIEQLQLLIANAQKGDGSHGLINGLEPNDLGSYFMRFLGTLRNIPSVSLFRRLSDMDEDAFKKLQVMETGLWREERNCGLSADANKLHALRYLLIQLLLQVLLQPEEFTEAASELILCCKEAFSSADLLGSSGDDELKAADGIPELMDVLLDTLLSLLPQSSVPMRSAIEQVYKYFCGDITSDGLMRMLRVFKEYVKTPRHHNAEDEDHDDNNDSEEDIFDVEEDDEVIEAEIGETGESDEQTDDSEAIDRVGEVDKELSDPSDDSEDSDGGMDDDAMFRMDSYLAQIFKERKSQAGNETAQPQLMLFKLRVLSLLEIYLHENPGKPLVLSVFSKLSQALVSPHATEGCEQLEQRIWGILQKKIFKAKDYPKGEAVKLSELEKLLEKNLKLASKPFKRKKVTVNLSKKKQSAAWNRYKMITSLAQNSTFWILKIIDAKKLSKSELQKVFDIFDGVLVKYFHSKKSQLKSEFLKEIIRRRPWVGHYFYGSILGKCIKTSSEFRRVEALDLIVEILRSLFSSENGQCAAKELMENFLHELCDLIKELLTNMPEKQSRRADVRKFCGKIFHFVSSLDINKSFLESLAPEAVAACEAQLGEQFSKLKHSE